MVTVAFAALTTAIGCNAVLGLDDYDIKHRDGGVDAADAASTCWRANGFPNGQPCFQCDASAAPELLNACTTAECVAFDNAKRISAWDGALGNLPDGATEYDAIERASRPEPTTSCSALKNVVYVYGSTALEHLFAPIAAEILVNKEITIVFKDDPSCTAVQKMNNPLSGAAFYYTQAASDAGPAAGRCLIDGLPKPDIVLSDVKTGDCGVDLSGEFAPLDGPVQLFLFAVPKGGGQTAISREAAHLTFAHPEDKRVAPWIQPELVFRRHDKSGTQTVIGANIGVPAGLFSGVRVQSSSDMIPALADASPPAAAIGITSPDQLSTEAMRKDVTEIAYQHGGQHCAFLPDFVAGALDKRNVRDGHYALWSPLRIFRRVTPPNANAEFVAHLFEGSEIENEQEYLRILKQGQVVPRCAMAVDRPSPGGEITKFTPERPCVCAFERAFPPAPDYASKCVACGTTLPPCATGRCSHGFCEP